MMKTVGYFFHIFEYLCVYKHLKQVCVEALLNASHLPVDCIDLLVLQSMLLCLSHLFEEVGMHQIRKDMVESLTYI